MEVEERPKLTATAPENNDGCDSHASIATFFEKDSEGNGEWESAIISDDFRLLTDYQGMHSILLYDKFFYRFENAAKESMLGRKCIFECNDDPNCEAKMKVSIIEQNGDDEALFFSFQKHISPHKHPQPKVHDHLDVFQYPSHFLNFTLDPSTRVRVVDEAIDKIKNVGSIGPDLCLAVKFVEYILAEGSDVSLCIRIVNSGVLIRLIQFMTLKNRFFEETQYFSLLAIIRVCRFERSYYETIMESGNSTILFPILIDNLRGYPHCSYYLQEMSMYVFQEFLRLGKTYRNRVLTYGVINELECLLKSGDADNITLHMISGLVREICRFPIKEVEHRLSVSESKSVIPLVKKLIILDDQRIISNITKSIIHLTKKANEERVEVFLKDEIIFSRLLEFVELPHERAVQSSLKAISGMCYHCPLRTALYFLQHCHSLIYLHKLMTKPPNKVVVRFCLDIFSSLMKSGNQDILDRLYDLGVLYSVMFLFRDARRANDNETLYFSSLAIMIALENGSADLKVSFIQFGCLRECTTVFIRTPYKLRTTNGKIVQMCGRSIRRMISHGKCIRGDLRCGLCSSCCVFKIMTRKGMQGKVKSLRSSHKSRLVSSMVRSDARYIWGEYRRYMKVEGFKNAVRRKMMKKGFVFRKSLQKKRRKRAVKKVKKKKEEKKVEEEEEKE